MWFSGVTDIQDIRNARNVVVDDPTPHRSFPSKNSCMSRRINETLNISFIFTSFYALTDVAFNYIIISRVFVLLCHFQTKL